MTEQPDEDDKGFLFTFILGAAFMILVYYFVIAPNFFGYSEPGFCRYAEQDAGSILASLSCYFSEPANTSCTSLKNLLNDATCGFSLNSGIENVKLERIGTANNTWWIVTVTDETSRCRRGKYYRAYMGTNLVDGWHE